MSEETKELVMPVIQVNGTGRELLAMKLTEAILALDKAYTTVDETFHTRDYYPLGEEKSRLAIKQHCDGRLGKLRDVRKELVAMYDHVAGSK